MQRKARAERRSLREACPWWQKLAERYISKVESEDTLYGMKINASDVVVFASLHVVSGLIQRHSDQ